MDMVHSISLMQFPQVAEQTKKGLSKFNSLFFRVFGVHEIEFRRRTKNGEPFNNCRAVAFHIPVSVCLAGGSRFPFHSFSLHPIGRSDSFSEFDFRGPKSTVSI